jgi:hypothetical protein
MTSDDSREDMETNTILERPPKVTLAVYILYSSLTLTFVRFFVEWLGAETSGDAFGPVLGALTILPVFFLLFYMIGKAKNWARVVVLISAIVRTLYVIIIVLGVVWGPVHLLGWSGKFEITCYSAEVILEIIALSFLYQRASSDWFKAERQWQFRRSVQGVSVLEFSQQSSAKTAGMKKGDVIIMYDGVGNLTIEKLQALAATPKSEGTQIRVLRDGNEYSLTLPSGSLGISAMDTTVRGPFGKLQVNPEKSS